MERYGFTNNFHDTQYQVFLLLRGSAKKLLMFIMLTCAASNDPTGAHDVRPTFAMNTSYVLTRSVFAKWAGKVFASLIKRSSLSNTKLGKISACRRYCVNTSLAAFFCLVRTELYFMSTVRDFTIGRLLLYEHAYVGLFTHFLRYMHKVFTYVTSLLVLTSGGFSRCVYAFFVWLYLLTKKPRLKTLAFAPEFGHTSLSTGRRLVGAKISKRVLKSLRTLVRPINAQDLYFAYS